MNLNDTTRTSPTLLGRTADWSDQAAWYEFVARYNPYLQAWCREYRLNGDLAAEVVQGFWIELAKKMREFRYDPSRRFRGWLRRSFHWRAVDAVRRLKWEAAVCQSVDPAAWAKFEAARSHESNMGDQGEEQDLHKLALLELSAQVKAAVLKQIQPKSWQVFCHREFDGWTIRRTANELQMSYAAVHACHKRVLERLVQEGRRRVLLDGKTETQRRQPQS